MLGILHLTAALAADLANAFHDQREAVNDLARLGVSAFRPTDQHALLSWRRGS